MIDDNAHTITFNLPSELYKKHGDTLKPYIAGSFNNIHPPSLEARKFYSEKNLEYNVTDDKGNLVSYTIIFIKEKVIALTNFDFTLEHNSFLPKTFKGVIDNKTHTITFNLPSELYKKHGDTLKPYIAGSFNNIYPPSLESRKFYSEKNLEYNVTDDKGNLVSYTITFNLVYTDDVSIKSFAFRKDDNASAFSAGKKLADIEATIDEDKVRFILRYHKKCYNILNIISLL